MAEVGRGRRREKQAEENKVERRAGFGKVKEKESKKPKAKRKE